MRRQLETDRCDLKTHVEQLNSKVEELKRKLTIVEQRNDNLLRGRGGGEGWGGRGGGGGSDLMERKSAVVDSFEERWKEVNNLYYPCKAKVTERREIHMLLLITASLAYTCFC